MSKKMFVCGSLPSIPDLRDYVATATINEFPETFELKMPAVKNQGNVGSCVAHALALVAEYFNREETGKSVKLSTGYIYGNRLLTLHKGRGMFVSDTLKTVTKFGDVTYDSFPENVEVPYGIELFDSRYDDLEDDGLNFKFKEYFKLKDADAIKANLMTVGPVVMSMYWYDDIEIVDGVMKTECVKTKKTGSHCMVIYGWDENGWKVQNSWGKGWGNKGRFILPYNVTMNEQWGITDDASDASLVIVTPFSSGVSALFARIIHKIVSWVYNIMYKDKGVQTCIVDM